MWKYLLLVLCTSCTFEKYNDPVPGQCNIRIRYADSGSRPFLLYRPAQTMSDTDYWLGVYNTREEASEDGLKLGCKSIIGGSYRMGNK